MRKINVTISNGLALRFHVAPKFSPETQEDPQNSAPALWGSTPMTGHPHHCGTALEDMQYRWGGIRILLVYLVLAENRTSGITCIAGAVAIDATTK